MQPQPIPTLTLDLLRPLLDSSIKEGYGFIQKLWDEYQSGQTTFRDNGAVLLGIEDGGHLIAIDGVHPDPYLRAPTVGRIRHVCVLPVYRRHGVGRRLVEGLIEDAVRQYTTLTLRTQADHGHAFYTALGFSSEPRFEHATHWLDIDPGRAV